MRSRGDRDDRLRRALLVILLTLGVALGGSAAPAQATPNYDWPGMKKCGTFKAEDYRIWVYAKHVSCRKARRIQKEYWIAPDSRKVIHNGGSGADGWVKLKRYPGWRCGSGAGGGDCVRGNKYAGYQN